jgi:putative redox protein
MPTRSAKARRLKGWEHEVEIRGHRLTTDEPEEDGGADAGPRPTELLAAALASCTATTIEMYAGRKEWELGDVEVETHFETPSSPDGPSFKTEIRVSAALSDDQRERILVIAGKCPVHKTLAADGVQLSDELFSGPAA